MKPEGVAANCSLVADEAVRRSLLAAAVVAGTALAMGVFRLPQPFLGVLAACLLWGRPAVGRQVWTVRVLAGWAGSAAGAGILVALPQQPWVSLPLFALVLGAGYRGVKSRAGAGAAMLFGMGMAASFPSGVVVASEGLVAAVIHGSALTVGAVVVAVAQSGDRKSSADDQAAMPANVWPLPLAAVTSVVISSAVFPAGSVVMTVASVVAADAFFSAGSGRDVVQRLGGAAVGALAGVMVLILAFGSTNDLTLYLAGLAALAAVFEFLVLRFPLLVGAGRQAAAAFVVVATSFPRPTGTMDASFERGLAVFGGVLLGALWVVAGRLLEVRRPEPTTGYCDGPGSACRMPDCDPADEGSRI